MNKNIDWLEIFLNIAVIIGILVVCFVLLLIPLAANKTSNSGNSSDEEVTEVDLYGTIYEITQEDRIMLAKLVYLEAGNCGQECQRAVVSVVLNRLESGYWGNTIEEVIYFPNAFSPTNMMEGCIPTQDSHEVVDYVLKNGPTVPKEVRYFRDDFDHRWDGYTHYATYDNIYFGFFVNGDH